MGSIITLGNTKIERELGIKINRIAFREYFYSLNLENFMRHTLERIFPPILENIIISSSIKEISNGDIAILSKYIILSWARTNEAREHMKESMEKGILETFRMEFGDQVVKNLEIKLDDNELRRMQEYQIMDYLFPDDDFNLTIRLMKFEWGLLKARLPNFFITSDTPVVFHNSYIEKQIKRKGKQFFIEQRQKDLAFIKSKGRPAGFIELTSKDRYKSPGVEGIEIYLPLSSKLCLYLVDKKPGFKNLIVKKINKLMILQSERLIFSQYNKLDFIKKIIKKHPECINKTGKRSIVKSTILDEMWNKKKKNAIFKAIRPSR